MSVKIALIKVHRGFDVCTYDADGKKGIVVYFANTPTPIHTCQCVQDAEDAIDNFLWAEEAKKEGSSVN